MLKHGGCNKSLFFNTEFSCLLLSSDVLMLEIMVVVVLKEVFLHSKIPNLLCV